MHMSLKLAIREMGSACVVDVSGRVTLGEGTATLRDTLRELVTAGHKKILLNLAELSYLDSSGIGVLVASFATISSQGGQLKLLNLTKRVQDLLLLTKLYTVFEVYDDEAVAVGSFAESSVEASSASV
jgi:anti-sigma B factor antagonist